MLSQDEIAAIKTLVGQVDLSSAQSNPNVFNEAVEKAIGKMLEHYQLTFMPVGINWQMGGMMQTQMVLVPIQKPVEQAPDLKVVPG